jgi:hypothetical protein
MLSASAAENGKSVSERRARKISIVSCVCGDGAVLAEEMAEVEAEGIAWN